MTTLPKKTIIVPFDKQKYSKTVRDAKAFRAELDRIHKEYPQIFPAEFANGYRMKVSFHKKRYNLVLR
jgi:hypothetical protein